MTRQELVHLLLIATAEVSATNCPTEVSDDAFGACLLQNQFVHDEAAFFNDNQAHTVNSGHDHLFRAAEGSPGVYVCAREGGYCHCDGTVFYAKTFKHGRPGRGKPMSFKEVAAAGDFQSWESTGGSQCDNRHGDPVYGFHKHCFCQKSDAAAAHVCAVEGGTCHCEGTVFYGKRYVSGHPGQGEEVTFDELKRGPHKAYASSGNTRCNAGKIGDPLIGYHKMCFCAPGQPETPKESNFKEPETSKEDTVNDLRAGSSSNQPAGSAEVSMAPSTGVLADLQKTIMPMAVLICCYIAPALLLVFLIPQLASAAKNLR